MVTWALISRILDIFMAGERTDDKCKTDSAYR